MFLELIGLFALALFLAPKLGYFQLVFGVPVRSLRSLTGHIVISGATDGIGRQLALLIAHKHPSANLVIIGRNQNKLDALTHEIKATLNWKGQVKAILHDFAQGTCHTQTQKLSCELQDLDVDLLINNCGQGYPKPLTFDIVSPDFLDRLLKVNLKSALILTRLCLGRMKQRNRGMIITTGSASRVACEPFASGYVTTKAGLHGFGRALSSELSGTKVIVQVHEPAWVRTNMTVLYQATAPCMVTDADCAEYMLRACERAIKGVTPCVISPHIVHAFQLWGLDLLPVSFRERQVYNNCTHTQNRSLRRSARLNTSSSVNK